MPSTRAAAANVGEQVDVPALRAEEFEIGDGGFAAGKDDQRRIERQRLTWRNEQQFDLRLRPQWVEVIEVRDVGQPGNDDTNAISRATGNGRNAGLIELHGIFSRKRAGLMQPGHDAKSLPSGAAFDRPQAVIEQTRIASKLIDDEAANASAIRIVEHGMRTDQRSNHVPTIDIAHQHDRHIGRMREAHVRNVVRSKIGFRRTAGALDDHRAATLLQSTKALDRNLQQLALVPTMRTGLHDALTATANDQL